MRRPEVAAKMSASTMGLSRPKSAQARLNIAAAAPRRMRALGLGPSKNELHFLEWAQAHSLSLAHTGARPWDLRIGRRIPDFRVLDQQKVVEVAQKMCFNDGAMEVRTPDGYGREKIAHYRSNGWACLVVFKRGHRSAIPPDLETVIRNFTSPGSSWSGVWHYDRLIPYEESMGV